MYLRGLNITEFGRVLVVACARRAGPSPETPRLVQRGAMLGVDDAKQASIAMRVVQMFGGKPQIYRRLSWNVLVASVVAVVARREAPGIRTAHHRRRVREGEGNR